MSVMMYYMVVMSRYTTVHYSAWLYILPKAIWWVVKSGGEKFFGATTGLKFLIFLKLKTLQWYSKDV